MAYRILCLIHEKHALTSTLAEAMATGIQARGDTTAISASWTGATDYDAVLAYGWRYWRPCLEAYRAAGKPYVFMDLAYWGRNPDRMVEDGFYKVTVNGRHPVVRHDLPPDRFARFGRAVAPWRADGRHILLAGMSAKNAHDLGIPPASWESETIIKLKGLTRRPILYRPKPTWKDARPLTGARHSFGHEPLHSALANCWAVVTHHSNVGVDGLLAGVPIYTEEGAARPFSMATLAEIERPAMPDGREAFFAGLAYCQWSLKEMRSGECWAHVRDQVFPGVFGG